jgi:hypothetical protein
MKLTASFVEPEVNRATHTIDVPRQRRELDIDVIRGPTDLGDLDWEVRELLPGYTQLQRKFIADFREGPGGTPHGKVAVETSVKFAPHIIERGDLTRVGNSGIAERSGIHIARQVFIHNEAGGARCDDRVEFA